MIRKIIYQSVLICFLFSSVLSLGQTRKERKAERNFDTYAYVEAIRVYENMAEKGYINTSILSKLGDSYYFNGKFLDAHKWYNQLFEGTYEDKDLNALDREYYYRYAQTLKAANQLDKADAILKQFVELKASDSRSHLFLTNGELVDKTMKSSRFSLVSLSSNSEFSDYGGTLLDNRLIFTSSRVSEEMKNKVHSWTNQQYTKLYSSTISEEGNFENPVLFAKEIASKELNMGTAVFSKDGSMMYFTSNNGSTGGSKRAQYNREDSSLLKIYSAKKQADGSWGSVEELPFNLEGFNTAHPALTPDGKWMYFVSDRQASMGQSDLFRVGLYDNGRFGTVEHLGDKINTAGRETFPFISSDYMLYFSSDGHPGFGGLDLYKSKINVDGSLGVPVNLGPDINSAFDDFGLYIDTATKKGFMSSNRIGGQGGDDIYLFVEKPCFQLIDGLVSDLESQFGIDGVEIQVFDSMQKQVSILSSDAQGYYSSEQFNCGEQYRVRVSKEGYFTKEFVVDTNRKIQQRVNITLEPDGTQLESGDDLFSKLKLSPIYFDFDQSTIRRDAQIELMKVVEVMLQHPTLQVDVRSHTDSRGNDAYNMKLSDRRAQATINWMISQGIEASRLSGKGYGESQLLNKCSNGVQCSDAEHQLNRRSEFIILNM